MIKGVNYGLVVVPASNTSNRSSVGGKWAMKSEQISEL